MIDPTPAMREALIAGLYPHLNGKTVDLPTLTIAVEEFLATSGYTDLVALGYSADQLVQAFQADTGAAAPAGYEALATDWTAGRETVAANPINSDAVQTFEP